MIQQFVRSSLRSRKHPRRFARFCRCYWRSSRKDSVTSRNREIVFGDHNCLIILQRIYKRLRQLLTFPVNSVRDSALEHVNVGSTFKCVCNIGSPNLQIARVDPSSLFSAHGLAATCAIVCLQSNEPPVINHYDWFTKRRSTVTGLGSVTFETQRSSNLDCVWSTAFCKPISDVKRSSRE